MAFGSCFKGKCWEPPDQAQRSLGPFGPRTPKESEKSPKGCPAASGPGKPQSPQRVRHGLMAWSPKRVQKRSFGLFLDSFRTPWRTLCGLFSDSFGVRGLKGPRDLCAWSGGFQGKCRFFVSSYFSASFSFFCAKIRPQNNFANIVGKHLGCTPRGSCNRTLLRRHLTKFSNSKCFLEGFLEGACKVFSKDKVLRRVLRRECHRRRLEGA